MSIKAVASGGTVWLNEQERIASFHAVDGYTRHGFTLHEHFMNFLQTLQKKGYRFQ